MIHLCLLWMRVCAWRVRVMVSTCVCVCVCAACCAYLRTNSPDGWMDATDSLTTAIYQVKGAWWNKRNGPEGGVDPYGHTHSHAHQRTRTHSLARQ